MSHWTGKASPPAFLISSAAVNMVPSNFGCGSMVFAAIAIFAPSFAAFKAIDNPIPLLPPVMKITLSLRFIKLFLIV